MSSTKTPASKTKLRTKSSSPAKSAPAKKVAVKAEKPKEEKPVVVEAVEEDVESSEEVESAPASPVKEKPVKVKAASKKKKGERTKAKRRVVTAETIEDSFSLIEQKVKTEIETLKKEELKGVKFLRTLGKLIRGVREDTKRILKKLSKKRRKKGDPSERKVVSGFCKLCKITPELATFLGCPKEEMKSRVDATRAIVDYVKAHNLQDSTMKKHINPDPTLKKLLSFTGKNAKGEVEHLTYPLVQRYIQRHFIKA